MKLKQALKSLFVFAGLCTAMQLTGCAATSTYLGKKDLDVQARTSTAVFVDPVARNKRTIYLDVRSGVMEFDRRAFKKFLKEEFEMNNDNGYRIVDNPETAQFTMVAYVMNLEKSTQTAADKALGKGYQGGSIVAGAAIGSTTGNGWTGVVGGGVIGGALELVTGSLVKDITYMLVADIQIKEKAKEGVYIRKDSKIDMKVSDSGASTQTYSEVGVRKEYRTRVVTTANKANLELNEAQDLMFKKTAYALAGFF